MVNRARMRHGLPWVICFLGMFVATPALATVTVTYGISNSYGYLLDSNAGADKLVGTTYEQHFAASSNPAALSELGVNYTAYAEPGGFYFLHQDYCVGSCSVYSSTVISVTLTNDDINPVDLRFDSMITPGHLAATGRTQLTKGTYSFEVRQNVSGPGGGEYSLYNSNGDINPDTLSVNQGGLDFNGYTDTYLPDLSSRVIDWGATNLSVPLVTIPGNSSSSLFYVAEYQVTNDGICTDLTNCSSLEVAFGDPRNDGSIIALRMFGAQSVDPLEKSVIGGGYDPFFIPFSFVPVGSQPQPDAPDVPVITYTRQFRSNIADTDPPAAPEPATWLTMICGFGLVGTFLRRRAGLGGVGSRCVA